MICRNVRVLAAQEGLTVGDIIEALASSGIGAVARGRGIALSTTPEGWALGDHVVVSIERMEIRFTLAREGATHARRPKSRPS